MATISGFLVMTLPETNNQKLPDSLKEAQEQDKRGETEEIGNRDEEEREGKRDTKTRL